MNASLEHGAPIGCVYGTHLNCIACGRWVGHYCYAYRELLCWNCHRWAAILRIEPGRVTKTGIQAADAFIEKIFSGIAYGGRHDNETHNRACPN